MKEKERKLLFMIMNYFIDGKKILSHTETKFFFYYFCLFYKSCVFLSLFSFYDFLIFVVELVFLILNTYNSHFSLRIGRLWQSAKYVHKFRKKGVHQVALGSQKSDYYLSGYFNHQEQNKSSAAQTSLFVSQWYLYTKRQKKPTRHVIGQCLTLYRS